MNESTAANHLEGLGHHDFSTSRKCKSSCTELYDYLIHVQRLTLNLQIPGDSRVHELLVAIVIPQAFTFLFVIGRIVSRTLILRIWGWDDVLLFFAWLNSLAVMIGFAISTSYGQGHRFANVPKHLLLVSFDITYAALICYQLCLCLTKISILAFYIRVFPAHREQWMSWGTIIFVIAFGTPLLIGSILQCDLATGVSRFGSTSRCFTSGEYYPFLQASTALHTVTDAWLIIMIIPVLSTLQIARRPKYALMGVLSLGLFVMVASIARLTMLNRYVGTQDITWYLVEFDIWTVWECSVGIICACAPTLRPLLRQMFPGFMDSCAGDTGGHGNNGTAYGRTENGSEVKSGAIKLSIQGHTATISTTKSSTQNDRWILMGNESEEEIIAKQGGIVKRTEYRVSNKPIHLVEDGKGEGEDSKAFRRWT
jgi:hypothetical protein